VAAAKPKPVPSYRVVNAPGGHYKVFPGGRRVFVASGTSAGQGTGAVSGVGAGPGSSPPRTQVVTGIGTGQGVGQASGRGTSPVRRGDPRDIGLPRDLPGPDPRDTGKPPPDVGRVPTPGSPPPGANPPPVPQGAADVFHPDAAYYADAAKRTFEADQQRSQLEQQGAYAKTDFDEALRRMMEKQPLDVQAAREAANRQGLLYSGTLARQEGDINVGYLRSRADQQQSYDRAAAAREAAMKAIASGMSIDDAAAMAAAVDRQLARDQAAADAGNLVPNETTKPPATTPPVAAAAAAKPAGRVATQPRKTTRVNGRTVTGTAGQGWGQIEVGPDRSKPKRRSARKRSGRKKGSGWTTISGSFAGAGGATR
jgi:hypothetical protein